MLRQQPETVRSLVRPARAPDSMAASEDVSWSGKVALRRSSAPGRAERLFMRHRGDIGLRRITDDIDWNILAQSNFF
jgi:hypothetical protein